jgi:hypothetical protein
MFAFFALESLTALFIALTRLIGQGLRPSVPACAVGVYRKQSNAIDRTHGHTQLASGAIRFDDGVHAFVGTHDGVGGAGFDAQGATNAPLLVNDSQRSRAFAAVFGVQSLRGAASDLGQACDASLATGWALVDVGLTFGHGLRIRRAIGIAATGALRLRQRVKQARSQIALDAHFLAVLALRRALLERLARVLVLA